ncbi:hypothetical protein [Halalkalibacter alkalisediminis]|uniref:Uncharacterized protein n=1 Tax=Halalkalibacter alkalisediminis TaxID=935616 RepID=A0ABV6NIX6_9BACI|nr:hypothetical protein [Halalkalibacter alkalisediminis]
MGLCLSLIIIGLTIGFATFGYVGLLLGLVVALLASWITNQIIYKKNSRNSPSQLTPDETL